MTAEQIRAEVEAAKAVAMKRFASDYGPNAIANLHALRKNNARALDSICKALAS